MPNKVEIAMVMSAEKSVKLVNNAPYIVPKKLIFAPNSTFGDCNTCKSTDMLGNKIATLKTSTATSVAICIYRTWENTLPKTLSSMFSFMLRLSLH